MNSSCVMLAGEARAPRSTCLEALQEAREDREPARGLEVLQQARGGREGAGDDAHDAGDARGREGMSQLQLGRHERRREEEGEEDADAAEREKRGVDVADVEMRGGARRGGEVVRRRVGQQGLIHRAARVSGEKRERSETRTQRLQDAERRSSRSRTAPPRSGSPALHHRSCLTRKPSLHRLTWPPTSSSDAGISIFLERSFAPSQRISTVPRLTDRVWKSWKDCHWASRTPFRISREAEFRSYLGRILFAAIDDVELEGCVHCH